MPGESRPRRKKRRVLPNLLPLPPCGGALVKAEIEEVLKSLSPRRMKMSLERIQKILAQAGIASRRDAERLILEGG